MVKVMLGGEVANGAYVFGSLDCHACVKELGKHGVKTPEESAKFIKDLADPALKGVVPIQAGRPAYFVDCNNPSNAEFCMRVPFYPSIMGCEDGSCRPISNEGSYLAGAAPRYLQSQIMRLGN